MEEQKEHIPSIFQKTKAKSSKNVKKMFREIITLQVFWDEKKQEERENSKEHFSVKGPTNKRDTVFSTKKRTVQKETIQKTLFFVKKGVM